MKRFKRMDTINIVPFIDIMLVLLAIVLSVSTFIAQGKIQIELPQSANQEQQKDEKKVKVLINKENQIYLDDSLVGLEELRVKLESLEAKTMVELHSDKDAKFETFIQIVDILKGKGHENFSIATQQQ